MTGRVRLIVPYYGPWPPIFRLFLDSCRRNPNLDVLFFTDNEWPVNPPANVSSVKMPFEALLALIACRLRITIPDEVRPYKLCDYRPAFGVIFEDCLKDAEFWGHADIDLIYGTTATFVTPQRLDDYDVLSFRDDWIHGPFTIYRNTPLINHLFQEAPDYRRHFEFRKYCNFDECLGLHEQLEAGADVLSLHPQPVCMTGLVRAAAREGRLRLHTEMAICESLAKVRTLSYRLGELSDSGGKRYIFYHVFREKKLKGFSYPSWTELPPRFHITDTGFYSERGYRWLLPTSLFRRARGHFRAAYRRALRARARFTRLFRSS